MDQEATTALLRSVYTGAVTGSESITDLLPKAEEEALRDAMLQHRQAYRSFADEAERRLGERGEEAREPGSMQKLGMKLGIEMKTAMESGSSRVAELMAEGSNMGIINLTKAKNSFPAADEAARDLCSRFIRAEQENIRRMKPFLQ